MAPTTCNKVHVTGNKVPVTSNTASDSNTDYGVITASNNNATIDITVNSSAITVTDNSAITILLTVFRAHCFVPFLKITEIYFTRLKITEIWIKSRKSGVFRSKYAIFGLNWPDLG